MIRFGRHAALLLALTAAAPAFAQDWRIAATAGAKPARSVYLIDAASIVRNGDTVTFMSQTVFESLSETRDFDRSVTKRQGTCSNLASRIMQNSYYARGVFSNTDSTPSANIIAHREGTVMYGVLQTACGVRAMQAGTIANPEAHVRAYFAK
ncbi:MAG: surface-adhesin E family protein [Pseudomonadota bacterium]